MFVTCRLRMIVLVHLIGQYILATIKSTKKHQSLTPPTKCHTKNISATMNGLPVQLSLTRKYHSTKNDTRRPLRIITKANTKTRQKTSNEKNNTSIELEQKVSVQVTGGVKY